MITFFIWLIMTGIGCSTAKAAQSVGAVPPVFQQAPLSPLPEGVTAPPPPKSHFEQAKKGVTVSKDEVTLLVAGPLPDKRDARNASLGGAESIIDQIKRSMTQAQSSLQKMKGIGARIPLAFKNASYFDDASITVEEPGAGGMFISFGYGGSGDLTTGFLGTKTQLKITGLPDFILDAALEAFVTITKGSGLDRVLVISPSDEFLFKLLILGSSKLSKKVGIGEFIKEFHLLLVRLYKTPSARGLNGVVDSFPPLFVELIKEINVGKRSIYDLLSWYGKEFEGMINHDFASPPIFPPHNSAAICRYVITILLHSFIDYSGEKRAYLKSPEGQQAYTQLQDTLKTVGINDKRGAYSSFNAGMPGYGKIKQTALGRLVPLLTTPFFVRIKAKMMDLIKPFLDELGISDSELDSGQAAAESFTLSPEELDSLISVDSEDLLFGDEDARGPDLADSLMAPHEEPVELAEPTPQEPDFEELPAPDITEPAESEVPAADGAGDGSDSGDAIGAIDPGSWGDEAFGEAAASEEKQVEPQKNEQLTPKPDEKKPETKAPVVVSAAVPAKTTIKESQEASIKEDKLLASKETKTSPLPQKEALKPKEPEWPAEPEGELQESLPFDEAALPDIDPSDVWGSDVGVDSSEDASSPQTDSNDATLLAGTEDNPWG